MGELIAFALGSVIVGPILAWLSRFFLDLTLAPRVKWIRDLFDRRDRQRLRRRMAKKQARNPRFATDGFSLATGFSVAFDRFDGTGDAPISRANLMARLTNETVRLPDELTGLKNETIASRAQSGWDNNPRYAVKSVKQARIGESEDVSVVFNLDFSDYANFLVTQRLDEPLINGKTLRAIFLDGKRSDEIPSFMLNSLGAHCLVVTSDNMAIFHRRSRDVAVQPGRLGVTMSEGLSRGNDNHGTGPPDLWRVGVRGLDEELGLLPDECRRKLLTVGLARDVNQWVLLFLVETPSMTAAEVHERKERSAKDKWEHGAATNVRFEPEPVFRFLFENWGELLSVVPPLAYHALLSEFGQAHTERELRSFLKKWEQEKRT